jgi:isoleucyl-tRNA synthetase
LDEFTPACPGTVIPGLLDIDRWILSDLQLLIQSAHAAFTSFNVMAFCLDAEKFVDDKLSNWYVRRNRRRFWKAEKGADKQAAYQTLYTVLVTLAKLCAPIIPFMTEKMYRNLVANADSVHLCDYPTVTGPLTPTPTVNAAVGAVTASVNASITEPPRSTATIGAVVGAATASVSATFFDRKLSDEMDALLRLVSLGGSARNAVKIKVRQPLAEIKIQAANDTERKAVERFADQIRDELNIKKVTLHDAKNGPLLTFEMKLNPKGAGPKFGPRLKNVQAALAAADPAMVARQIQEGKPVELACSDGPAILEPTDVWVTPKVPTGWAGIADHGTQILLDGRLTPELELEGLAREVIRNVQTARKDAGLEMSDRIALVLQTDDAKLKEAIRAHCDYIANETLVVNWATDPLVGLSHRIEVKIESMALNIELKKWTT